MNRRALLARASVLLSTWVFAYDAGAHASEDRLAIKGYDPVAYFTVAKPMVGDPRFEHEWDGAVFRFASAEHLELFKADPDRYVPQHHNLCTIALSRGEKVVADPNNWAVHEGRLYLFGKPIGRERLLADPAGIKERADANYATVSLLP
jgi:YHS domain-containing protein